MVQRRPTREKSNELLVSMEAYFWRCSDVWTILGECTSDAPNTFALGPNGLDSAIRFLLEYAGYVAQSTLCTGLKDTARGNECRRLDDALKTIHLRISELVAGLTSRDQRDQIDPPGFREAERAYRVAKQKLLVSPIQMSYQRMTLIN